jgi:hypothetical protein
MADPIRGFAFPFQLEQGAVVFIEGPEKLRQNIVQLLLTDIGERVMRRDYGGGLRAILHDPNNDALRAIVQHQVSKALVKWEPRAQLQQFAIDPTVEQGTFWANVSFAPRPNLIPTTARVPIGANV